MPMSPFFESTKPPIWDFLATAPTGGNPSVINARTGGVCADGGDPGMLPGR